MRGPYEQALATLAAEDSLFAWTDLVDAEHPYASPVRGITETPHRDGRVIAPRLGLCAISDYTRSLDDARGYAGCHMTGFDRDDDASSDGVDVYAASHASRPTLGRSPLFANPLGFAEVASEGTPAPLEPARVLEGVLGDEGVLFDTSAIRTLRPRARRLVPMASFEAEGAAGRVEDGAGREWRTFTYPVFDRGALVATCKAIPGGHLCLASYRGEAGAPAERWVANHARYHLARYVMRPAWWPAGALERFEASDDFAVPRDLSIERVGGELRIRMGVAGVEVRTERPLEAIRVRRALARDGGEATWFTSAVDVIFDAGDSPGALLDLAGRAAGAGRREEPGGGAHGGARSRRDARGGRRRDARPAPPVPADRTARDELPDGLPVPPRRERRHRARDRRRRDVAVRSTRRSRGRSGPATRGSRPSAP